MQWIACHVLKEKTQSKAMHKNKHICVAYNRSTSKLSKFCGLYETSGVMKHTEHENMYAINCGALIS